MQQFRVATPKVSVPELQILSIHSLDQSVLLWLSNFTKSIWSERERGGGRERERERDRDRERERETEREREREIVSAAVTWYTCMVYKY